jgi:MFS family permease
MRAAVAVSCWLAGLGMAGLGLAQGSVAIAGILLGLSGIGAGALQTLGPTLAVESVDPEERGAALSASGLFRSAALFLTPLVVAGGVLVAPLGPVLVVTGVLLSLPGFGGRAGTPRPD